MFLSAVISLFLPLRAQKKTGRKTGQNSPTYCFKRKIAQNAVGLLPLGICIIFGAMVGKSILPFRGPR